MKYSIKFYNGCRVLKDVDEISIIYSEKDAQLLKFAKKYKNARIVADCTALPQDSFIESLEIFETASKNFDFAVKIDFSQKDFIPNLKENAIKYFFVNKANTLDKLVGFIDLGVSDVYVADELGFYLAEIAQRCHDHGVSVRVYPNVAQSSSATKGDTFKYFYIRPEDVDIYEPYVDYMEFFGSIDRQSVLFKIYKEGQWLGSLNTLILGLEKEIPNTCIVPYFGQARVGCRKRCLSNQNCEVCNNIIGLAEVLENKDFGITSERKRIDKRIEEEEDD